MKRTRFFITGTDTGVGKTVLTALLTHHLRERGINAAALKPVCSGSRADARMFRTVMGSALTLDEINPWHFRGSVAPALAARRENRRVMRSDVLAHVRAMEKRFNPVLIEGAGGLLSPLGEDFDSLDLIAALRAIPIIVCPNRLGAVNQALLAVHALPHRNARQARVVLMSPPKPDTATRSNAGLLAKYLGKGKVFQLPWLGKKLSAAKVLRTPQIRRAFQLLARI